MSFATQFPPLGQSNSTKDTYLELGGRLARRMAMATGSTDPSLWVAHFITDGQRLSQRTFRLYKAALLHHLQRFNVAPSVIKVLGDASSKNCAKKGAKTTSGAKAKKVSGPDRGALLEALRESGSSMASLAADYFEAGLILGPRPIEWVGASITALLGDLPIEAPVDCTHLVVFRNAKRDQEGVRGNGDERSIYVTLTAGQAALITRVMADAALHGSSWKSHYDTLRAALRYVAMKLWPRRNKVPCFYTTRHQCQADAKASGLKPNEIAALFGHASDNTSTQHYARTASGDKNMCKLRPTALSLARVRNQTVTFRQLSQVNRNTRDKT